MNTCPSCNQRIGFAGLKPTGRNVYGKKWYQLAKKELCCPHCKTVLIEVNTRPVSGRLGILVLILANLGFAIVGLNGSARYIIFIAFAGGFTLLAFHLFGYRVARERTPQVEP